MRVILALDKFKGTFSAEQASRFLAQGIVKRSPQTDCLVLPMADGGEGTGTIIASKMGMVAREVPCTDLVGRNCKVKLYWHNERRIALIESCSVLGELTPNNELFQSSSSLALGLLFKQALALHPAEVWIGVGGTLTADAGWGFASVLGLVARDASDVELEPCLRNMPFISSFTLNSGGEPQLRCRVVALCDVNAPAAPVADVSLASFLPQKGADARTIPEIVSNLERFTASLSRIAPGTRKFRDAFTGAGGGLVIGMSAVIAELSIERGCDTVARVTNLEKEIAKADLVICGEGKLDRQTFSGKAPVVVSELALKHSVPLIGVFGRIEGPEEEFQKLLHAQKLFSLFQVPPENRMKLLHQSESRLVEIGIDIAHRVP